MKAVVQIGVRRQGRVVDHAGPHWPITKQSTDMPDDFTEQQLAVSVTSAEITRAFYEAGAQNPGFDTIEFMVDFEED